MKDLSIAPAKAQDLPALRELYLTVRRERFFWLDPAALSLEDLDRDTAGERIWAAHRGGELAGFLSLWEEDRFVHCLYVKKEFRGLHIAGAPLKTAREAAGGPLSLKCMQANTQALGYYLAHGWKTVEEGLCDDGPYYLMTCP